jgi:hypothetical protein
MHISPVTSISVGISRNKVEKLEKFSRSKCSLIKNVLLTTKKYWLITLNIYNLFEGKFRNRIKFSSVERKIY